MSEELEQLAEEVSKEEFAPHAQFMMYMKGREMELREDWGAAKKGDRVIIYDQIPPQAVKRGNKLTLVKADGRLLTATWESMLDSWKKGILHFTTSHDYHVKWIDIFLKEHGL